MSIKDRIKGRQLPSETYRLAEKDVRMEAAQLAAAQTVLRRLDAKGTKKSTAAYKAAKKQVDEAKATLDACYMELTVSALPADEYDTLIAAHPPTAEQEAEAAKKNEEVAWNDKTFQPALLAASVDSEMDADDWAEARQSMTKAEFRELWVLCLSLNEMSRQPQLDSVGKGLGAIQSLLLS